MTDEMIYKESEQKVKEMEKFARGNEREEKSFLGSETLFRAMAEKSGEGMSLIEKPSLAK